MSNRPDMISGGDVLVGVEAPEDARVVVKLNGVDVTARFEKGAPLVGLITGLKIGNNEIEVFGADESQPAARLVVTNHSISGPVFSGPQEHPFICQTDAFQLPDGSTLGAPLDSDCSARMVVQYVYRSTSGAVKPLRSTDTLPQDVARTTTSLGRTVPYVVRVETGTINRSIYQIAVLHDPTSEAAPTAFAPAPSWNRRLLYSFGGGCPGGWFKQGASLGTTAVNDNIVGKGYASVSATLNVFGNNCSDLTAAETMMMVKEHFIETYGRPAFTFGRGGSGGSYQQIQIADNYPGLLDGIIPSATFPDVLATIQFLVDVQLLDRYFKSDTDLTDVQKRAVAGVGVLKAVAQTAPGAKRIQATGVCPAELPQAMRYDPATNPTGARCDVFDHTVNAYGRDPVTGFARRPVDNTGVQYGLAALNDGMITPRQFLDLNEKIGGYDNDGNMVASRAVADPQALRAAYETGRVTFGGGGLAKVPIIDARSYFDAKPGGDLHLKYHSFGFRERLLRANGTTANEVLLVVGERPPAGFEAYTIARMDEWLTTGIKPSDLVDSCYTASGERIIETQTFRGGKCNDLYPTYPSPRMVAGGPVTNDVLKCQLKPIDLGEYKQDFTEAERQRLTAIFPDGVCDWSKPGVGQTKLKGAWLVY